MASTGLTIVTVGANASTGVDWTNPGNITAEDLATASVGFATAGTSSKLLTGTNLGFSIQLLSYIFSFLILLHN